MLTRRGISALLISLSLTAVGWVLVIRELMVVGVAVGLVTLVAFTTVWFPFGNAMQFSRSFATRGVHSGDFLRVDLAAEGRWTPMLSVQERLPGGRSVTATLAGKGQTLTFETPALPRGLNLIGPTIGRRADFFGLFHRTSSRSSSTPLIVWPARIGVDHQAVRKLLVDPDQQPRIGVLKPGRPVAAFEGDLRAYVPGDEPRRIHWPSSARTGNLVVRTDASVVSDNRYVLTIDLDTSHHNPESFELILSVATSLVLALLPVPVASLHREDSFDDDLFIEVLEGEHSSTPGRNRFRYPELLLDHLALATFRASKQRVGGEPSRVGSAAGGLLLGGPSTTFTNASKGLQCGDPRTIAQLDRSQPARSERPGNGPDDPGSESSTFGPKPHVLGQKSGARTSQAVLQISDLHDLPQLLKDSAKSARSTRSSSEAYTREATAAPPMPPIPARSNSGEPVLRASVGAVSANPLTASPGPTNPSSRTRGE